jgi:hypothetical protein
MITAAAVLILVLFAALWAAAIYYGSRPLHTPDDIAQDAPEDFLPVPARIVAPSEPATGPDRVYTVVLKEGTRLRTVTGKGRRPFRLVIDGQAWEPCGALNGVPVYARCDRTLRQIAQRKKP